MLSRLSHQHETKIFGSRTASMIALSSGLAVPASLRGKYEYRHKWRHGDWVMWDNRSVMHQANADYDMNERRYLYRLMLKGEVPA
jgi:alpha-ketoglutarate-dependent taurine dioxygenase